VSSQYWLASLLRSKSSAPPSSTFAPAIKEPGSDFAFARFAGLLSSIPKKVTTILWASQLGRLPTLPSQRLKFPSMIAAGTRGFSCRQARERSTKIPPDYKLCRYRTDFEVTPNHSSCSAPFAMMSGRTRTERHEDFQSSYRTETICHYRSLLVSIQAFNGGLSRSILPIRTHRDI
jgi:hypothetical protein